MFLLLFLLTFNSPVDAALCPNWFSAFGRPAARNQLADVVLGRAGNSVVVANFRHKNNEAFQVLQEDIALISRAEYQNNPQNKPGPWHGTHGVTGKPIEIPKDSYIVFSNQLSAWAQTTNVPRYTSWNIKGEIPVRATAALAREVKQLSLEDTNPLIKPEVFRHVFEPYLKKMVGKGGRLHVNIHTEDEAFLRGIAQLPEGERKSKLVQLKKEYFAGKAETGSLTRLELLTIASDPELYSATIFYHDYARSLDLGVTDGLWIGSGQRPAVLPR